MRITVEDRKWGKVVKVSGSLDALTTNRFEEFPPLQSRVQDVALDLTELEFTDSVGLGALVRVIRRFERSGRKLIFVNPAEGVLGVLKMTSVDRIVPIVSSVGEAENLLEKETAT